MNVCVSTMLQEVMIIPGFSNTASAHVTRTNDSGDKYDSRVTDSQQRAGAALPSKRPKKLLM